MLNSISPWIYGPHFSLAGRGANGYCTMDVCGTCVGAGAGHFECGTLKRWKDFPGKTWFLWTICFRRYK